MSDVVDARAGSCDITPDGPALLAGYAGRKAPSRAVLDRLEIGALVLEFAPERCVLLTFDLMAVGQELEEKILAGLAPLGFSADSIFLMASHTHFAPATDLACAPLGVPAPDYVERVAQEAVALVSRLLEAPGRPLAIDLHRGKLAHSIHRRRRWPFPVVSGRGLRFGAMAFAPNPQGSVDETASVLALRDAASGTLLAILWHYTCHPTAVVPSDLVSADFPGAVRRRLRERFGDVPCLFLQGFCGDIRPNLPPRPLGLMERARRDARKMLQGPTFAPSSPEGWRSWSESLAEGVVAIAAALAVATRSPDSLAAGHSEIPLSAFFHGTVSRKTFGARVLRLGRALEIIALSAEPCQGWAGLIEAACPPPPDATRLYAGYLGSLYGYLPTPCQVPEGGYEVDGFQPLFGLSGRFDADALGPAVTGCVRAAYEAA